MLVTLKKEVEMIFTLTAIAQRILNNVLVEMQTYCIVACPQSCNIYVYEIDSKKV